ncbi:MAG: hypothetical protein U0X73_12260 [Thermoanaerobaculia bacterium]
MREEILELRRRAKIAMDGIIRNAASPGHRGEERRLEELLVIAREARALPRSPLSSELVAEVVGSIAAFANSRGLYQLTVDETAGLEWNRTERSTEVQVGVLLRISALHELGLHQEELSEFVRSAQTGILDSEFVSLIAARISSRDPNSHETLFQFVREFAEFNSSLAAREGYPESPPPTHWRELGAYLERIEARRREAGERPRRR